MNFYVSNLCEKSVEKCTSKPGLRLRRFFMPKILRLLRNFSSYKVTIEHFPKLVKNQPYIFASNHVFRDDIETILTYLDRNAYLLLGSEQTMKYDRAAYALWLNGVIPLRVSSKEQRKLAYQKMKYVLESGTSVLIFPENAWNFSENRVLNDFYHGPVNLNRDTGIPIVPIAFFREDGKDEIFIHFSEPVNLSDYYYREASLILRDLIASVHYKQIENHASRLKRSELGSDSRMDFLKSKRHEAMLVAGREDDWANEAAHKKTVVEKDREEILNSLLKVRLTEKNYMHVLPLIKDFVADARYDFIKFMEDTWEQELPKYK